MCRNQLLLAGLSTGSVYFLTVPSDHTVLTEQMQWQQVLQNCSGEVGQS